MKESKYYVINDEYMAKALSYVGFQYVRFPDNELGEVYSFERSERFFKAMTKLVDLRKEFYSKKY